MTNKGKNDSPAPRQTRASSQSPDLKEEGDSCFCCGAWNVEGAKKKDTVWISCSACNEWWHVKCAGMAELTTAMAKSLKSWNCHFCFVLPDRLKAAKLANEVSLELKTVIQDAIKVSVEDSVQNVIINNVVEEANQKIAKSWAQIASGEQTKLIAEVVEVTCAPALSKSIQLIEANLNERRNRARNIVVSNLPDSEEETEEELKELICTTLRKEIAPADITSAKRIGTFGKPNERAKKKYRGRLVIATLKREDDASYLHKNGRGYAVWGKTEDENVWVNADLPKADRDAKLLKRQGTTKEDLKQRRETKFKPHSTPKETHPVKVIEEVAKEVAEEVLELEEEVEEVNDVEEEVEDGGDKVKESKNEQ